LSEKGLVTIATTAIIDITHRMGDAIIGVGGLVQHDDAMPQIKNSIRQAKAHQQPVLQAA